MISKIQKSWRQLCDVTIAGSFQTGLKTAICMTRVRFRRPFIPNSFFASMLPWTGWVGAPKLSFSPGLGNPRYATGPNHLAPALYTAHLSIKAQMFKSFCF